MNDPSTLRFRVRNDRPHAQQLVLEPWGDVRELAAGEAVVLNVTGSGRREIEIELSDVGIVFYGSAGDVIDIVADPSID